MKSLTLALGDEVSVCSLASSWSIVRLAQGAGVVRGVGAACVSTVTDLRTHFMCVVCVCVGVGIRESVNSVCVIVI